MKWSWKIARVAGIDVYIHATRRPGDRHPHENLGEFLMIQAALKERTTAAPIVTAGSVSTTRSAVPPAMAGKSEMA